MTVNEIRKKWLDFFKEKNHYIEKPQSLIPVDDDSLLFINSGVATLKKFFDGSKKPVSPRIANAQKSLRTNDIENVGITSRHQTMFEMLGNFSIGDYFKIEAIEYAYEILTSEKWFNIGLDKLYFTVHPADSETYNKWIELGIDPSRIVKTEENFWEIGTGPGGPNTEIHYDRGVEYDERDPYELLQDDLENDRIIEIWNIVFSQYNCQPGVLDRSEYEELPQKNIDTGMGLERMACILQDVETNFETDTFQVIIKELEKISNTNYEDHKQAYRVIVDHVRALTFTIADGIVPANDGRGYVLRRLLRRSSTFGYTQLNMKESFLAKLVDKVVEVNSEYYPYLLTESDYVKEVITTEEEKFLKTIADGYKLFENYTKDKQELAGDIAFKLYDTYGFPIELTTELCEKINITVDIAGFENEMELQRDRARSSQKRSQAMSEQQTLFQEITVESNFIGYDQLSCDANVLVLTDGEQLVEQVNVGDKCFAIFNQTPFYAESGGQKFDTGFAGKNKVINVQKIINGQFLHEIEVVEPIKVNQTISLAVDAQRRQKITKNHSATHLLHLALDKIIGKNAKQAGSSQDEFKTRFDFSALKALTSDEVTKIEKFVNDEINRNSDVVIREMPIAEAKALGANALFGEKYGDIVRVVTMGESLELCGGTHVKSTNEIGKFHILSESGIGSGIRRIEAITGTDVDNYYNQLLTEITTEIKQATASLSAGNQVKFATIDEKMHKLNAVAVAVNQSITDIEEIVASLKAKNKKLKSQGADQTQSQLAELKQKLIAEVVVNADHNLIEFETTEFKINDLMKLSDELLNEVENVVIIFKVIDGAKVSMLVKCSKQVTDTYKANVILNERLAEYQGRGGGTPEKAQGGGTIAEREVQ